MTNHHSPAEEALLVGRSVYQPRRPGFWLVVAMLAVGGAFAVPSMASTIGDNPVGALLAIVLAGAFGALLYWLIQSVTFPDPKPPNVSLTALGLGAVFVTAVAPMVGLPLDHIFAGLGDWGPAFSAATGEESYKALAVVALFLAVPWWWQRAIDGMAIGALVGLGFQIWEDIAYIAGGAGGATPDVGESLTVFLDRVALGGLASHAAFTALFGAGLGYAVSNTNATMTRRLAVAVAGFGLAWGTHLFWDSPLFSSLADSQTGLALYSLVKSVPVLALVVVIARIAVLGLRTDFVRSAEPLLASGAITDEDMDTLGSWRRRLARRSAEEHDLLLALRDLVRLGLHGVDADEVVEQQANLVAGLR